MLSTTILSPKGLGKLTSLALTLVLALTIFLLAVGSVQAADQSYKVQPGDNLTSIAARFGLSVDALALANGIANVNNIYAGQTLKIPQAVGSNSNNNPAPPTTGEQAYIVQRGDTLSGIASRFGLPLYQLASLNKLSVMSFVYIGQTLRVPGGETAQIATVQPTIANTVVPSDPNQTATPVVAATPTPTAIPPTATSGASEVPTEIVVPTAALVPTDTTAPADSATAVPADTVAPLPTNTVLSVVPPTAVVAAQSVPLVSQTGSYTVQQGDALSNIALKYGVSVQALQQANNISNPDSIFAGQKLVLSGVAQSQATVPTATNLPVKTVAPVQKPLVPTVAQATQPKVPVRPLATLPVTTIAPRVVKPTPTQVPAKVVAPAANAKPVDHSGKWIDVNLSQQTMTAYDGKKAVFSTLVSTGVSRHPTVTGTFNIYVKYESQAMSGGTGREYYYLPGVPYVMYFYESYALHGTYWHHNFGTPMSHGCVNLPTPAAKFMYSWASVGTPVTVHY